MKAVTARMRGRASADETRRAPEDITTRHRAIHAVFLKCIPTMVGYTVYKLQGSVNVYSRAGNFLETELLSKFLRLQDVKDQDPGGGGRSNESQIFNFSGSVRLCVCIVFVVCARNLHSALSKRDLQSALSRPDLHSAVSKPDLHSALSKSKSRSNCIFDSMGNQSVWRLCLER